MNKALARFLLVLLCIGIFLTCTNNQAPEAISINGPDESFIGESNTFSIIGTDLDIDSLSYLIDWGDGDSTGWSDYFPSGESIQVTHTYSVDSIYSILALAKDVNGDTSTWSEPHTIAILTEIPQKWELVVPSPSGDAIASPPAISDDGTVYFNVNGLLFAIDSNGTQLWSYDFGTFSISSPSIGDDGTIYIANGEFTALNPNGTLNWTYTLSSGANPTGGAISSDGSIIFGATDSCIYALNPDGSLNWSYQGLGSCSAPIIGQSGNIYFGTENGYLYAITPDGNFIWKLRLSSSFCCPGAIADDETIYTLTVNGLSAVNSDGTIEWTCSIQNFISLNRPGIGADGTIYIGDGSNLHAISPNGTILWSSTKNCHTTPAITQDNYIIAPIAMGGMIHEIYKINSAGILRARSKDSGAANHVAIANNGTIYASGHSITHGFLFALEGNSPLASSSWPMYQHDARHTGRAGP